MQGDRYGQDDDTKVSNVAVGTIHPLGWIWNKTENRTIQISHKLNEKTTITVHTLNTKFVDKMLI